MLRGLVDGWRDANARDRVADRARLSAGHGVAVADSVKKFFR